MDGDQALMMASKQPRRFLKIYGTEVRKALSDDLVGEFCEGTTTFTIDHPNRIEGTFYFTEESLRRRYSRRGRRFSVAEAFEQAKAEAEKNVRELAKLTSGHAIYEVHLTEGGGGRRSLSPSAVRSRSVLKVVAAGLRELNSTLILLGAQYAPARIHFGTEDGVKTREFKSRIKSIFPRHLGGRDQWVSMVDLSFEIGTANAHLHQAATALKYTIEEVRAASMPWDAAGFVVMGQEGSYEIDGFDNVKNSLSESIEAASNTLVGTKSFDKNGNFSLGTRHAQILRSLKSAQTSLDHMADFAEEELMEIGHPNAEAYAKELFDPVKTQIKKAIDMTDVIAKKYSLSG